MNVLDMQLIKYVADFFKEYHHCFYEGNEVMTKCSDVQIHDYIYNNYHFMYVELQKEMDSIKEMKTGTELVAIKAMVITEQLGGIEFYGTN